MSDDDFWGEPVSRKEPSKLSTGRPSHSPPRSRRSRSPPPPRSTPKSQRHSEEESAEDRDTDSAATRSEDSDQSNQEDEGSESRTEAESEEEGGNSERSDDSDPLSDVWDSGDETSDDEEPPCFPPPEMGSLQTARGVVEVDITPPSELLARAEYQRKKAYRDRHGEECVTQAIRCLALTKIIYGNKAPWAVAMTEAWLAKSYYELFHYYPQTLQHAEEARRLLLISEARTVGEGIQPPDELQLMDTNIQALYLIGRSQIALGKLKEARVSLTKAAQALKSRREAGAMNKGGFWTTELETAWARLKLKEGSASEALPHLNKVERLMISRFGEDSSKLLPLYSEMSQIAEVAGDEATAVEAQQRCYDIVKESKGDDSVPTADEAVKLASVQQRMTPAENEAFIESFLNEAIEIYSSALGQRHTKTLSTKHLLGRAMAAQDKSSEALVLLKSLEKSFGKVFGEMSRKKAALLKDIASWSLQIGDSNSGVKYLKLVLEIEAKTLGNGHATTQGTAKALSVLLKNPSLAHLDEEARLSQRPTFRTAVKALSNVSSVTTTLSKRVTEA